MKSILLHVHDDDGQEARLQTALDLVRANEGHLTCVQTTSIDAYVGAAPFYGSAYLIESQIEDLRTQQAKERAELEERLGREGVSWDWVHAGIDSIQAIVDEARLADIVVMSRAIRATGRHGALPIVADVALYTRGPVLAVPDTQTGIDLTGPALVAWNGSAEAANALRAGLPFLRMASGVEVLVIDGEDDDECSGEDACAFLSRHGIRAVLSQKACAEGTVADMVMQSAWERGASYVVMGAYGRSRIREYILGGVTRQMLEESRIPLLLSH